MFEPRRRQNIFFFSKSSTLSLGPIEPTIQRVPGVKEPERDVDHSPPSIAQVKNKWNYKSTLLIRHHGVYRTFLTLFQAFSKKTFRKLYLFSPSGVTISTHLSSYKGLLSITRLVGTDSFPETSCIKNPKKIDNIQPDVRIYRYESV
jgi:hypothetical protein